MKSLKLAVWVAPLAVCAWAQSGSEHWVATWGASPQVRAAGPGRGGNGPAPITAFNDQTVRMIVRSSLGGKRARVQLSNAFGAKAVKIGAAHIALRGKESMIVAGSDRALTFSGKPSFTIPPGALAVSDPVDLDVPQVGDLAVSVYLPSDTGTLTMHATGLHTTYITSGNAVAQPAITEPAATSQSWYFLSSVDVVAPADAGAIVTFGDSITDGARSTADADRGWPIQLAQRLAASGAKLGVVNQGISGNRVLRDNAGINALARFDRDVLGVSGVKWLTILESINDIGQGMRANALPEDVVTADDLIAGLRQMVERAHLRGIRVAGCTLTPFEGAAYYSEAGEAARQAINQWIRSSGVFDAVIDFDAATRDSANPKRFAMQFDSGDHLHPGDVGYKAMADAIDVKIFTRKGKK